MYRCLGADASPQIGLEIFVVHEETFTSWDASSGSAALLNLTCLGSGHQGMSSCGHVGVTQHVESLFYT